MKQHLTQTANYDLIVQLTEGCKPKAGVCSSRCEVSNGNLSFVLHAKNLNLHQHSLQHPGIQDCCLGMAQVYNKDYLMTFSTLIFGPDNTDVFSSSF